jgi:anti-sigma factor RsiW
MGHDDISKRLSAYLDGEVSVEERAEIDQHVAECGICAAILQSLRDVSALVRGADLGSVDAAFMRRLHTQLDNLSRRGVERFAWGLSAVAACIAIMASIHLFMPATQTQSAAVPAPDAWEGAALKLNTTNDDVAPTNNGDLAMTQWRVADLSTETRTHE